jgi:hypothetical protein
MSWEQRNLPRDLNQLAGMEVNDKMQKPKQAMYHYPAHPKVMVSITTPDGELLDRFPVSDYRDPDADAEYENVGSATSQMLLAQRIARYVTRLDREIGRVP